MVPVMLGSFDRLSWVLEVSSMTRGKRVDAGAGDVIGVLIGLGGHKLARGVIGVIGFPLTQHSATCNI